jgi:hypothetical protein
MVFAVEGNMKHFIVGCVVLPFVALACTGSSEDGDGDGNAALSGFIADYCDAFMPCCAEAGLPADGARCRALFGEAFGADDFEFDEAAADECSSWFETVSGTTAVCDGSPELPAACGEIFTPKGDGAPGDRCSSPGDCALSPEGGVRCVGWGDAPRSCQLVIEGVEGSAPCGWTVLEGGTSVSSSNPGEPRVYSCDVADGLRCDGTACVRLVPTGGSCVLSEECELGTYCASASCTPKVPTGGACTRFDECAGGACQNSVCAEEGDLALGFICGSSGT